MLWPWKSFAVSQRDPEFCSFTLVQTPLQLVSGCVWNLRKKIFTFWTSRYTCSLRLVLMSEALLPEAFAKQDLMVLHTNIPGPQKMQVVLASERRCTTQVLSGVKTSETMMGFFRSMF